MSKEDFEFYKMLLEEELEKVYTDYDELSSDLHIFYGISVSSEELRRLDNEEEY